MVRAAEISNTGSSSPSRISRRTLLLYPLSMEAQPGSTGCVAR
jgi:hypothetical protein